MMTRTLTPPPPSLSLSNTFTHAQNVEFVMADICTDSYDRRYKEYADVKAFGSSRVIICACARATCQWRYF
jgi:hypothetical protein